MGGVYHLEHVLILSGTIEYMYLDMFLYVLIHSVLMHLDMFGCVRVRQDMSVPQVLECFISCYFRSVD